MRVLISIGHPAHIHLFKNLIWALENQKHEIKIIARDRDIILQLLDSYGFDYYVISKVGCGRLGLGKELLIRTYNILKIAIKFKPDLMVAVFDPSIAQIGKLLNISTVIFIDNEPEVIHFPIPHLTIPFARIILTLTSVKHNFGAKEIKMNGYKEIAYLHPHYFSPDIAILETMGVSKNDKFILIRFVAWNAYHDINKYGFGDETKNELVNKLEKYARIFITSEGHLPPELEKYRITFPADKIHDALYYAQMLVSDSQTMTTEAGVLGVPALRCNSFVGENDMGNFIELEQEYGLIFNYSDPKETIDKAIELIQKSNIKDEWRKKRDKLLCDKIDVTAFMVWLVGNYPESLHQIRQNPDLQYQFK